LPLSSLLFVLERDFHFRSVGFDLAATDHQIELGDLCDAEIPERFARSLNGCGGGFSQDSVLVPTSSMIL